MDIFSRKMKRRGKEESPPSRVFYIISYYILFPSITQQRLLLPRLYPQQELRVPL